MTQEQQNQRTIVAAFFFSQMTAVSFIGKQAPALQRERMLEAIRLADTFLAVVSEPPEPPKADESGSP